MKKILSLLLAAIMIFSVSAFTLAGAADVVTVTFYAHDGVTVIEQKNDVVSGGKFTGPANAPERENEVIDGLEYIYTFKGWAVLNEDGTYDDSVLYYSQTFDYVTEDTDYIAVYSEKTREPVMTFWNLIEMIFSKFNMIFEYFSKIFG